MTTHRKSQYVTFYKVMLILSTIGTAIAGLSIFSLPDAVSEFSIAPFYGISVLADYVILLVSIVALILLWQKRIEGYYLKMGTYVATIVTTVLAMFTAQPYITYIMEQASTEAKLGASEQQVALMIANVLLYAGLTAAIVVSGTFMLLWRAAWKRQAKADKA